MSSHAGRRGALRCCWQAQGDAFAVNARQRSNLHGNQLPNGGRTSHIDVGRCNRLSLPQSPYCEAEVMGQQGQKDGARFAVGFSFAGEDRALVAPLAEELARHCGRERVLFDRYLEAELAQLDLDVYLPRLYRDETELIVVLLSPDYPNKSWCGLELRWIRQLISSPDKDRIMLLRVGDPGDLSELGILPGDGYLDVSARAATEISALILQRMVHRGIRIHEAADPGVVAGEVVPMPSPSVEVMANPFGDRGCIRDPARFFDRDELLRRIFEELGKPSSCRRSSSVCLTCRALAMKTSFLRPFAKFWRCPKPCGVGSSGVPCANAVSAMWSASMKLNRWSSTRTAFPVQLARNCAGWPTARKPPSLW
jgi:hypothetical protein